MRQANIKQNAEYDRSTLTDLFILLGGFISMITRLTNFALRGYQSYALDKSLIKKVFSVRRPPQQKVRTETEAHNLMKASLANGYDQHQNKLKDAIQERTIFSYPYRKNCWRKFVDSLHWFFCACWCQCCCPRKPRKVGKEERLFIGGLSKLYTEIDLLEVVKQLRISRFLSSL